MDICFTETTVEFLCVAFHSILYYTSIYPKNIFECRKKYNTVVYRSIHPEVNQYIDLCMKVIADSISSSQLSCVEFIVTDKQYEPVLKFVFQFETSSCYDETEDAYLIQSEQNLRAFCLKLSSLGSIFNCLPEESSFTIYIHTNESTALSMAANPELEAFPLIEVEEKHNKKEELTSKISPLRRFTIRNHKIETYVEVK